MECKITRRSILDDIQCDYSFVVTVDNQNLTYFGQASFGKVGKVWRSIMDKMDVWD